MCLSSRMNLCYEDNDLKFHISHDLKELCGKVTPCLNGLQISDCKRSVKYLLVPSIHRLWALFGFFPDQ